MSVIPYLTLAGFMGIHNDIITVNQVSVKAGGSISTPCLYDQKYRNNVKYLCQGFQWQSCSPVVNTDQPKSSSGKFSISDDTNQGIFTVTINNITENDTYWCAVKIVLWKDVKQDFQLSVTTGMSDLYVHQQEIIAFEQGSVTVVCHYKYPQKIEWCRLGSTCVTDQSGSIHGTAVTINASVVNVFTVTMTKLRKESSGWYWCAKGDLQMPVHITVNELPSTTVSPNTARTLSTTRQHSSLVTSVAPCTAQPTNATITRAGGESSQNEPKRSSKAMIIIITLVLQLLIVLAAFLGWRIRLNKTKPGASGITAGSHTGVDLELYATVVHNQHEAAQKQDQTPTESVTYSTIVIRDGAKQMTEPEDGSVIYSTVGRH